MPRSRAAWLAAITLLVLAGYLLARRRRRPDRAAPGWPDQEPGDGGASDGGASDGGAGDVAPPTATMPASSGADLAVEEIGPPAPEAVAAEPATTRSHRAHWAGTTATGVDAVPPGPTPGPGSEPAEEPASDLAPGSEPAAPTRSWSNRRRPPAIALASPGEVAPPTAEAVEPPLPTWIRVGIVVAALLAFFAVSLIATKQV